MRVGTKALLIELSRHLERQAETTGMACLVVAAFQHMHHITAATRTRLRRLSERTALVAALGADVPAGALPGVRGGALAADDPLLREWDVVVLGPRTAGALASRDLGDTGPDLDRRFEFVLSHDVELAVRMAGSLLVRVEAQPPDD